MLFSVHWSTLLQAGSSPLATATSIVQYLICCRDSRSTANHNLDALSLGAAEASRTALERVLNQNTAENQFPLDV